MLPRIRTICVLAMVGSLVLVSSLAGCLSNDDDDNGNGNGKEDPVMANAGNDAFGEVDQTITLNASTSSGPIQSYTWTIQGPNASSPDNITKVGQKADHTFAEAGVYTVTLLVEGKKEDNNSTDTMMVFIDLMETQTGQLQNIQVFNKTYEYSVWPEVQSIKLKLTYPTTAGSPVALPINLDMDVWTDGQTPYATTTTQTPNPTADEQVEDLDLQVAGVITNEGFRVVIRWGPATTPPTVDFTLEVEIHYRAV
ncbi:MAG: PKD domain-containing protein [Thermoplasmata archaeon]|nr:PKD domain-containing protein [Thermoplasmata archaeon]